MQFDALKRIHFIGIGGIGISYVAHFFLQKGAIISGSDLNRSVVTDQLAERGVTVFQGHDAAQITDDIDLVIYNDAIPQDNPELLKARELRIPTLTNFEVVGRISRDHTTIVVAGNKGKTTTTAMLADTLANAGCDPTAMVGSIVNAWKCNFRHGESDFLVVEGDEFKEHFLQLDPKVVVITNLEPDHLDYFGSPDNYLRAFQQLIDKLPNDGLLVINRDDELTKQLNLPNCQVMTFGMNTAADVFAANRQVIRGKQTVEVSAFGNDLGEWHLPFPGRFNVENMLAATAVAMYLGVEPEQIAQSLAFFQGTWRRFEILGMYNLATVISDYAHHPAAINATIGAARDFYGDRRIVAVFQPHTHHRTKALFDDFVRSFDGADLVILADIFDVAGREKMTEAEVSSSMLADAIRKRDTEQARNREVIAAGDLKTTRESIDQNIQKDDVLLMMGAGDIYRLAEELVKS